MGCDDLIYRNLQEQVEKNKEDIELLRNGIRPEIWINFEDLGSVTTEENVGKFIVVSNTEWDKDRLYVITKRKNGGLIAISLGDFPATGPQGEQGPVGPQGEKGRMPKISVGHGPLPQDDINYKEGDIYIVKNTTIAGLHKGDLWRKDGTNVWHLEFNLTGPQGLPGLDGDEVIANPEGMVATDTLQTIMIDGIVYSMLLLTEEEKLWVQSISSEIVFNENTNTVEIGTNAYVDGTFKVNDPSDIIDLNDEKILKAENIDYKEDSDVESALDSLSSRIEEISDDLEDKQDKLTFDNIPIENSNNVVKSGGVFSAIAGIKTITYEIKTSLPTASSTYDFNIIKKIYLIKSEDEGEGNNYYNEYICVKEDNIYKWELIGTTKIDLENYLPLSGGVMDNNSYITFGGEPFLSAGIIHDAALKRLAIVNYIDDYTQTTIGLGIETINLGGIVEISKKLIPSANNIDLGDSTHKFRDIYINGNLTDGTNTISVANIINKSVVSGTNDGTYWTKITINGVEKNIPSGGSSGNYLPLAGGVMDQGAIIGFNPDESASIFYSAITDELILQKRGDAPHITDIHIANDKIILGGNLVPLLDNTYSLGGTLTSYKDIWIKGQLKDGTNSIEVAKIESKDNKVTSITSFSTDTQYPSAKAVYDLIVGSINGSY